MDLEGDVGRLLACSYQVMIHVLLSVVFDAVKRLQFKQKHS
jgi:hypothetical protein